MTRDQLHATGRTLYGSTKQTRNRNIVNLDGEELDKRRVQTMGVVRVLCLILLPELKTGSEKLDEKN